jgi:hypothetical protein
VQRIEWKPLDVTILTTDTVINLAHHDIRLDVDPDL